MFVPIKETEFSLTVKKSRFIAILIPFTYVNELETKINEIKKRYPKATHYLYAYKVRKIIKCNNAQEPGNIAQSFLTLLNQYNLDEVLLVVVRYFGGIKLGASNLLRTYHDVANEVIKHSPLGEKALMNQYHFICDYATFNKIKHLGYSIENVNYFDKIELDVISKLDIISTLKELKVEKLEVKKIERVIYEHD